MIPLVGQALLEPDAIELLQQFDIPYPRHGLATTVDEAVELADMLGYPVVLKVVSLQVLHKSDVGGVRVDLCSRDDVRRAYQAILDDVTTSSPGASVSGMLVCRQAPDGLEVIVGALQDDMFGPTLMVGLGGVLTEVLDDVSLRLVPIEALDAKEMIRELRGYPLIAGTRGMPAVDEEALVRLLLAVSHMLEAHPGIRELDLNPVRVYEQGLLALDVRLIRDGEEE
jgi:acyl-CoA synthetase (NDP forming)